MADQSIACPSCGKKIPLTRALRTEIEASVKADYERQLQDELERARKEAVRTAEKRSAHELDALRDELRAQGKELADARQQELALRRREPRSLHHRLVCRRQSGLDDRIEHRAGGNLQPLDPLMRAAQPELA